MRNSKLLILAFLGLASILMLAGLIGAFIRLVNLPALFIAFLIIFTFSYYKGWHWWKILLVKNRLVNTRSKRGEFHPSDKKEAAKESLKGIENLISRIQNKVASEGLKQEQKRIENELQRGDLVVVVFGTGSSGKTSLIRALLNKIVGNVEASMGSTKTSQQYRLRLKGIGRCIRLIDTPGILEGGREGRAREKESLLYAGRADLIVVVIDNDLRSLEMEFISTLAKVGKRLFIVLNKCDLRSEKEEERLIALIRGKCNGLINSRDVIATSASPQSVPMPGGRPYQPNPEIEDLIKRMASVLHEEGEELLADNILLQCKNIGESGRVLLKEQRFRNSMKCVERYAWISSGVVVITPLPIIDMIGAAAVNAQMVLEISEVYGIKLTKERAQELALSVGRTLAGLGIVKGSINLISSTLSLSVPTLLLGRAIQGVTAAWLTRVAGSSFITYFEQDQDWGDGGIQEIVQQHYDLNMRESTLRNFMHSALERVIEPLQKNEKKQLPPRPRLPEEEEA